MKPGLICITCGLGLTGTTLTQAQGLDIGDRLDRLGLRKLDIDRRISRSVARAKESEFAKIGRRVYVLAKGLKFVPALTVKPDTHAVGASGTFAVSPQASYYYVNEGGLKLDADAKPIPADDHTTEPAMFDGDDALASAVILGFKRKYPAATVDTKSLILSVQPVASSRRKDIDSTVGTPLFLVPTANFAYIEVQGGAKIFSVALDLTNSTLIPNWDITWTSNWNRLTVSGSPATEGLTFDLSVSAPFSLGRGPSLKIDAGYTLPSRFNGDWDYFARVSQQVGEYTKLRVKLAKDNVFTMDLVWSIRL